MEKSNNSILSDETTNEAIAPNRGYLPVAAKKVENALFKFCRFLDEYCPSYFTLFLFFLFGFIAFLIHKYRIKDAQDIAEQKEFDKIFNYT